MSMDRGRAMIKAPLIEEMVLPPEGSDWFLVVSRDDEDAPIRLRVSAEDVRKCTDLEFDDALAHRIIAALERATAKRTRSKT